MAQPALPNNCGGQNLQINHSHRYAVVTGANKGIGFQIAKQLASKGITVILTARNHHRGLQSLQTLKQQLAISHHDNLVVFHQLDVVDTASIQSLLHFITTNYGKLDILVNNAGVSGVAAVEGDPLVLTYQIEEDVASIFSTDTYTKELKKTYLQETQITGDELNSKPIGKIIETIEGAEECIRANFHGAKAVTEALLPLLLLSDSPRIVNVSSMFGTLKLLANEWGKRVLADEESLTEEKVDGVVREFLNDFKEGRREEANGWRWPAHFAAYKVSKAALNAYTRILAKKHPEMCVNCVCPGFARTDMTCNEGPLSAAEAAENVVALAVLPEGGGPSGLFFYGKEASPF